MVDGCSQMRPPAFDRMHRWRSSSTESTPTGECPEEGEHDVPVIWITLGHATSVALHSCHAS